MQNLVINIEVFTLRCGVPKFLALPKSAIWYPALYMRSGRILPKCNA